MPSGVNEQPIGHAETLQGAANRLDAAKAVRAGADYYVAIESGLVEVHIPEPAPIASPASGSAAAAETRPAPRKRFFDTGWVLLERPGSGERAACPSCGVEFPSADVTAMLERGVSRATVAAQASKRAGLLDGQDPHAWLTAGRRTRDALLGEAIAVALGQLERASRPGRGAIGPTSSTA